MNSPEIGFIFISFILLLNLILTMFTLPYIKLIYNIFKILTDLVLLIFTIILIIITFKYKELLNYSLE